MTRGARGKTDWPNSLRHNRQIYRLTDRQSYRSNHRLVIVFQRYLDRGWCLAHNKITWASYHLSVQSYLGPLARLTKLLHYIGFTIHTLVKESTKMMDAPHMCAQSVMHKQSQTKETLKHRSHDRHVFDFSWFSTLKVGAMLKCLKVSLEQVLGRIIRFPLHVLGSLFF